MRKLSLSTFLLLIGPIHGRKEFVGLAFSLVGGSSHNHKLKYLYLLMERTR